MAAKNKLESWRGLAASDCCQDFTAVPKGFSVRVTFNEGSSDGTARPGPRHDATYYLFRPTRGLDNAMTLQLSIFVLVSSKS